MSKPKPIQGFDFRRLGEIIMELPKEEREQLIGEIQDAILIFILKKVIGIMQKLNSGMKGVV